MLKVTSPFEAFQMNEEEQRISKLFTQANKAFLHNLRTEQALALLSLKYDVSKHDEFVQAEAELHGAIGILDQILLEAEAAETNPVPTF